MFLKIGFSKWTASSLSVGIFEERGLPEFRCL